MQIEIHRSGGCFGIPKSAAVDTATPVGSQTRVGLAIIERLAAAVRQTPQSLGQPFSTAPRYTVTIRGDGAPFSASYDSVGLPDHVRALVQAVEQAAVAGQVQRPGDFEIGA